MTDDAPTPDGASHDEDAVTAPRTADARASSLEDIAHVLSARTPDIAGDPRPEPEDEDASAADSDEGPEVEAAEEPESVSVGMDDAEDGRSESDDAEGSGVGGDGPAGEPDGGESAPADAAAEESAGADERDAEIEESAGAEEPESEAAEEHAEPGAEEPEAAERPGAEEPGEGAEVEAEVQEPGDVEGSEADESVDAESVEAAESAEAEGPEAADGAAPADAEVDEAEAEGSEVDESVEAESVEDASAADSDEGPEVEAAEEPESVSVGMDDAEDGRSESDDAEGSGVGGDGPAGEPDGGESAPADAAAEESAGADEADAEVAESAGAEEHAEPGAEEPEAAERPGTEEPGDVEGPETAESVEAESADAEGPEVEAAEEPESVSVGMDDAEDGRSESDDAEGSGVGGDGPAGEPDGGESAPADAAAEESAGADEADAEVAEPAGAEESAGADEADAEVAESAGAEEHAEPGAEEPEAAERPGTEEPGDVEGPETAESVDAESVEAAEPETAESPETEEPEAEAADGAAPADAEVDEAGADEVKAEAEEPGVERSEAGGTDAEAEEPGTETGSEELEADEADASRQAQSAQDETAEDVVPEPTDAVTTPVDETLAAMSALTPAEPAPSIEALGSAREAQSAEAESGETDLVRTADTADSASEDAPATAAGSASDAVEAALARSKDALARATTAVTTLLRGHRPSRGVLACIVGLGLLVVVWGGAVVATTQHVFAGSTVSGVDVGDTSPDEARRLVADQIGSALARPVVVAVNESTDTLVPADSGVAVDADASVDRLTGPTINPVTLIKRLSGTDVDAVTTVDSAELTAALNARLDTLATGTADAVVTIEGTTPVVTPGSDGTGLDVEASVKALSSGWPLGKESISLVGGTAKPAITDEDARAFVDAVLTPMLSDDITITASGTDVERVATGKQLVLTPNRLADVISVSTADGALSVDFDSQRLHDDVISAMGPIETQAVNAGWTIDGSATGAAGARPRYVSPSPGQGIDMDSLTQQLLDAGTTGSSSAARTIVIPMMITQPEIVTAEADWGVVEVTGEFSTPFNSEPGRDQNLIRGAEQMNGQIVMPGETFSVEEALGPVDYEHGFTDAGVISNGQHVDALGGGLSQIGTTMFNVGFEAGMDDVEHHPHSYYFSRYPAGREATLWTGQKDVKFANSTPYAALIQAWVADGEVHARIWSTHYYDVSITSSERYNYRPVQTITRPAGAGCQSYSGGSAGFDITVTRTRTAPDKTPPDDVLTTTYDADNNIECGGTTKPAHSVQPGPSTTILDADARDVADTGSAGT